MIELRGITWDHTRGRDPMLATAAAFELEHPDVKVTWLARSLHDFGHYPVDELANAYDLVVVDHPWVGFMSRSNCFLPIHELVPQRVIQELANGSVGPCHASYNWDGSQWALAIDAATPCASYRPDLLAALEMPVPQNWEQVLELGRAATSQNKKLALPLGPVDAITAFLSLAVNMGAEPFATSSRVVDDAIGEAALAALQQVIPFCTPDIFTMSPITIMDRMSQSDDIVYCPLAYGYSNYARPCFRQHLCLYADMPGIREPYARGSHLGGTGIAISRRCRYPEVAGDYAARVAGAEWQSTLYYDAGGQPAHSAAWNDEHVNDSCHGFFRATRRTIDAAYVRPRYDGYIPVQYEAGAVLTDFLAGHRNRIRETLREINGIYAASHSN